MDASFDAFGNGTGWGSNNDNDSASSSQRINSYDKIPFPVTITELQKLGRDEEKFRIGQYCFNTVRTLGVVASVESDADQSCITYSLIDTSMIDVKMAPTFTVIRYHGIDTEQKSPLFQQGTYVQAVGKIRWFNERLSLISFNIREVESEDIIECFDLDTKLANIYYSKNIPDRSANQLENIEISFFSSQAPVRNGLGATQTPGTPGRPTFSQLPTQQQTTDHDARKLYQNSQTNNNGLSGFQSEIYNFVKENCSTASGISIKSVENAFPGKSNVAADLAFLVGEGFLYNTLDEDHFAVIF